MLTIMGTLERPTSGRCASPDATSAPHRTTQLAGLRAHEIGFVFQRFHLQEAMTAVDNVANGMLYTGQPLRDRGVPRPARRSSGSASGTGSSSRPRAALGR